MIPAVLIYLLKANIALALVFLAYRLGLRRLTFYTLNRVFLLMGIVISSAFPLVNINPFVERHEEIGQVLTYVPDFSQLHQQQFNYWNILVYIFWTGVLVMLVRTLVQSFSMWRIHKTAVNGEIEGTHVKLLNKEVNPFSFFRNIYVNPRLHQPQELHDILNHEQVHVRQWHSIDVVLGEINNIFYWFNPGAWLMKSAIRENLEFITDRYLIRQGIDKKNYQYNLLKISGIPYATAIANNFNFSHLKNRIMMMNKKRSSTFNMFRYVILGSMVGGLVLSLNYSKASAIIEPLHILPVKDTTAPKKVTVTPVPAQADQKTIPVTPKPSVTIITTVEPQIIGEADTVKVDRAGMSQGATYVISLPDVKNVEGKAVTVNTSPKVIMKGNAVFVRDTPEDTSITATVTVTAVTGSGEVKTITTTSPKVSVTGGNASSISSVTVNNAQSVGQGQPNGTISIRGTSNGAEPLYVLDGVILSTKSKQEVLKNLDPNQIASINVLKGKSATDVYGEAGKDGVVQIITKAAQDRDKH